MISDYHLIVGVSCKSFARIFVDRLCIKIISVFVSFSVKGKRYFECMMKYGGFVRPSNVTVGYYPEANELDEF